jgi:hypothetical protein
VIENIVRRNNRDGERAGEASDGPNPLLIVTTIGVGQRKVEVSMKQIGAALNMRFCGVSEDLRKGKNKVLGFGIIRNISEFENALSFVCTAAAYCEKLCEIAVGFAIGWITENALSIRKIEPASYNEASVTRSHLLQSGMRQHNSGERVAICESDRAMTVFISRHH